MKPLTPTAPGSAAFLRCLILFLLSGSLSGCFQHFYSVKTINDYGPDTFSDFQEKNKYFILHSGDSAYELSILSVDTGALHCTPYQLPEFRRAYENTNPNKPNRYRKSPKLDQRYVLDEVHLYSDLPVQVGNKTVIPVRDIYHVDLFVHDRMATGSSALLGVLGITSGAALAGVMISSIASSSQPEPTPNPESCPFIYCLTDTGFRFIGEIYSGAIYPSLERDDYLTIADHTPDSGEITLKISNELKEIQHTNLTELLVFSHPEGIGVLVDKYGHYQTLSDPQTPSRVVTLGGVELKDVLDKKDDLVYSGINLQQEQPLKDGVILTFKRPADATLAKLVINAVNTPWLDYVVSNFHLLFGTEYNCWVEKQKTVSPKLMKNWVLNQNIPLSVYVEKNGKWSFIDYFNIVGPMAAKTDVLPLDLTGMETDSIRVRLEYGNKFWLLDYAAIDFTVNVPVRKWVASCTDAIDKLGKDVRKELVRSDDLYYEQPLTGDEAFLKFRIPPKQQEEQTLILHSRGYYVSLINPEGQEQRKYLLSFRKKSRMPEFSNQLIHHLQSMATKE